MPVYFIQAENGLIKIGHTRGMHSLPKRVRDIEALSPIPVTLLGIIPDEKRDFRYHWQFNHLRQHGEWFKPGQDLLDFISQNAVEFKLEPRACKECGDRVIANSKYCAKHQKVNYHQGMSEEGQQFRSY